MSKGFLSKTQPLIDESQTVENFFESKSRSIVKKMSSSSSSSTTNAMGASQSPMDTTNQNMQPASADQQYLFGIGQITDTPKKKKAARNQSVVSEKMAQVAMAANNVDKFVQQLDNQIETLLKNEKKIDNYHNEDKPLIYGSDVESSLSSMSAETVSSLNDDTARIIFQGNHKYRFEADESIRVKHLEEMELKKKKKELQNSCLFRLKKGSLIRKPKNTVAGAAGTQALGRSQTSPNNMTNIQNQSDTKSKSSNKNQQKESKLANMKEFQGKMVSMNMKSQIVVNEIFEANEDQHSRITIEQKGLKDAYKNDKNIDHNKTNNNDTANINEDDIFQDPDNNMNCEKQQSHEDEMSEEQQEIDSLSFEVDQTCTTRLRDRLRKMMISPDNKKLRVFHIILALIFYLDIIVTSLLMGTYHDESKGEATIRQLQDKKAYSHENILNGVVIIQCFDIILNFFKMTILDIHVIEEPWDIFLLYFKDMFWSDLVATYPYHLIWPGKQFLILRLVRARRYKQYRGYLAQLITDSTSDQIDNQKLKKMIEFFNLTLLLILMTHFFACIWVHIGTQEWSENGIGWIQKQLDNDSQDTDFSSLYITSIYWVMTSFTSIGYGDVTGATNHEYLYQMLVEIVGICIFSYMTGLIQGLLLQIGGSDKSEENQEEVTLWLVKLDRAVKERKLSKQLFEDVRTYFELKFRHDIRPIILHLTSDRNMFFHQLKPRLKNQLIDVLFEKKYLVFQDVFENCNKEFVRKLVIHFEFRMYMPDHNNQMVDGNNRFIPMSQLGEKPNIFRTKQIQMPFMNKAFEYSTHIHFIQSGQVYIMDPLGLYQYGVIKQGSYFGDISVLLGRPNVFSYMYNPFSYEGIPLMTYQIERRKFLDIIKDYPFDKELWCKRAKRRLELFESYKCLTLLKIMKTILKDFKIIKQNTRHLDASFLLHQRVLFFKEFEIKQALMKLLVQQYEIMRWCRRRYITSHHIKRFSKSFSFQDMMSKTLSKENQSKHFQEDSQNLCETFGQKLKYKLLMQNQSLKNTFGAKIACFSDDSDDHCNGQERSNNYIKSLHQKIKKMQHQQIAKQAKTELYSSNNQQNSVQQSESPRHSTIKNSDQFEGGSNNSSEFDRSGAMLSFNQYNYKHSYPKNTEEKIVDNKQSEMCLTKKEMNYMINSYQFFHHNVIASLNEQGDKYDKSEYFRTKSHKDLESCLLKNVQQIQCCLFQYFEFKRIREKRKEHDLFKQMAMKLLQMKHGTLSPHTVRAKDLNHMDKVIEEYIAMNMKQQQIFFQNLEDAENLKAQPLRLNTYNKNSLNLVSSFMDPLFQEGIQKQKNQTKQFQNIRYQDLKMFQNEVERCFKKFDNRLKRKQDQLKGIDQILNRNVESNNRNGAITDSGPIHVRDWVDKLDMSIQDLFIQQLAPKLYEYRRQRSSLNNSSASPTGNQNLSQLSVSKINSIVRVAGGSTSTLTLTLLWTANYDYDLHLKCHHGKSCNYNNKAPCDKCNIKMDVEMQNFDDRPRRKTNDSRVNYDDGLRDIDYMVENITIQRPMAGHTYEGHVDNYTSPNTRPCDYRLILRSMNDLGEDQIVHQWHMQANQSSSCPRAFHFSFTWPRCFLDSI